MDSTAAPVAIIRRCVWGRSPRGSDVARGAAVTSWCGNGKARGLGADERGMRAVAGKPAVMPTAPPLRPLPPSCHPVALVSSSTILGSTTKLSKRNYAWTIRPHATGLTMA